MEDISGSIDPELAASLPVIVEHRVRVEEVDAATVVLLAQELEAVQTAVARSSPVSAMVVVDLAAVRLLTAAGLRCLVAAASHLAELGHRLIVVNPTPVVAKVLELEGPDLLG